jgi:polyisoprenoid-binding protein YceI
MKHSFFFLILMLSLIIWSCKDKKQNTSESASSTTDTKEAKTDATYQVDPKQSNIKWLGNGPTKKESGSVPVSASIVTVRDGQVTSGNIKIEMTQLSVTSQEGKMKDMLESHLKGTAPGKEDDFFNVSQYPDARFEITSTSKLDNDPEATHMVNGNLTMKGITKPISFKARIELDGDRLIASAAPFDIDRTEFNIKYQSKKFFDNLKDDFINDTFQIGFYVVATKK